MANVEERDMIDSKLKIILSRDDCSQIFFEKEKTNKTSTTN